MSDDLAKRAAEARERGPAAEAEFWRIVAECSWHDWPSPEAIEEWNRLRPRGRGRPGSLWDGDDPYLRRDRAAISLLVEDMAARQRPAAEIREAVEDVAAHHDMPLAIALAIAESTLKALGRRRRAA